MFEKLQQIHQEIKEAPKPQPEYYLSDDDNLSVGSVQSVDEPYQPGSVRSNSAATKKRKVQTPTRHQRSMSATAATSNSFMIYCQAMRPTLQIERPELTFSEQSKVLANNWKLLPMEEKAKYEIPSMSSTMINNE